MTTNASAFTGHTDTPKHVKPSKRAEMVRLAQWCAANQKPFVYDRYAPKRSEFFHEIAGVLSGKVKRTHADCSQWYAAIGNHCGIKGLTDQDWTGTLLTKGRLVYTPTPGDCVIFGGGSGEHAAMITYNGFTIGFGHSPGAPNRVALHDMAEWFRQHGHPGVRYLSFVK
jgi:hypothetical protein